jgi:hypothetical protein
VNAKGRAKTGGEERLTITDHSFLGCRLGWLYDMITETSPLEVIKCKNTTLLMFSLIFHENKHKFFIRSFSHRVWM